VVNICIIVGIYSGCYQSLIMRTLLVYSCYNHMCVWNYYLLRFSFDRPWRKCN